MIYVYTVYFMLFTIAAVSIYFVYGAYASRKAAVKARTQKYIRYFRRVNKRR